MIYSLIGENTALLNRPENRDRYESASGSQHQKRRQQDGRVIEIKRRKVGNPLPNANLFNGPRTDIRGPLQDHGVIHHHIRLKPH